MEKLPDQVLVIMAVFSVTQKFAKYIILHILILSIIILYLLRSMTPPDVTDINSLQDAIIAIESGKISKTRAEFIAQALQETNKSDKKHLELANNLPQLEHSNFSIPNDGWPEHKIIGVGGAKYSGRGVREVHYREQFFSYEAALIETEKEGKKMPATGKVYEDILEKKYQGDYQKFLAGEHIQFCGLFSHGARDFLDSNDHDYASIPIFTCYVPMGPISMVAKTFLLE